jgi:hypothetical protein
MKTKHLEKIEKSYDLYLAERNHYTKALIKGESKVYMSDSVTESERTHLMSYSDELPLPHELEYDSLIRMPTQLTKILQVQRTLDHLCFWAWTAEVIDFFGDIDRDVQRGYFLLLHVLLSKIGVEFSVDDSAIDIDEKMQENSMIDRLTNRHIREIERNPSLAAYVSYPLLEGLLKHVLSDVIYPDGEIKAGKKLFGDSKTYDGDSSKAYERYCNSLKDLLHHAENHGLDSDVQAQLRNQKQIIEQFGQGAGAYDLIYNWRNTLLHGEGMWDFQAGLVTNIASLLIWNQVDGDNYDEDREEIVDRFMTQVNAPIPTNQFESGFYPPAELNQQALNR